MLNDGVNTGTLRMTIQDLAECNLCARGSKRFLEKRGICFRTFIKEGLPLDAVIAWNDGSSNKVVEHILRKNRHEG